MASLRGASFDLLLLGNDSHRKSVGGCPGLLVIVVLAALLVFAAGPPKPPEKKPPRRATKIVKWLMERSE